MPLNAALVGRAYPAPEPYEVGREAVRAFADAVGEPSPLHRDPEAARAAGHRDVVAPPTFLTALTFRYRSTSPVTDPALGLDYSRVVHGEQSFALHRPVVAGDVLHVVQQVDEVRAVGANELVGVTVEVTDDQGEPVATMRSVLVSRGTAPARDAG